MNFCFYFPSTLFEQESPSTAMLDKPVDLVCLFSDIRRIEPRKFWTQCWASSRRTAVEGVERQERVLCSVSPMTCWINCHQTLCPMRYTICTWELWDLIGDLWSASTGFTDYCLLQLVFVFLSWIVLLWKCTHATSPYIIMSCATWIMVSKQPLLTHIMTQQCKLLLYFRTPELVLVNLHG